MTEHAYGLGRFTISADAGGWRLSDRLMPPPRWLDAASVAGLKGRELERTLFVRGFVAPCTPLFPHPVADAPGTPAGTLFWQFPCRTEAAAHANHAALQEVARQGDDVHSYLGLPWATFIDTKQLPEAALQVVRVRLSGLRHALAGLGLRLRLHTVCQHVEWRRMLPLWAELGVTDAWLSHAPAQPPAGCEGLALHPWSLWAVNVEDPQRRSGLHVGRDVEQRPLLASFTGAHMPNYLSNIRLRLRRFEGQPGFVVKVHEQGWHFEDVVYRHQVQGQALASSYRIDDSVSDYNRLLSDSVFALCPAGAGPNTLRLWEALAAGAIPVLLGPLPQLPRGGSLAPIAWDDIVLTVPDDALDTLPQRLAAMPLAERRQRQQRGLQAYALVRAQRCF